MKNSLFTFMAECISFLVITEAHGQVEHNLALLDSKKNTAEVPKPVTSEKGNNVNMNSINSKALKNFKKLYKVANNEEWFKLEDGFTAKFTSNGISNMIYYNKKGRWSASLKIYGEDKFSRVLRDMIRREYLDYKITSVQEIETLEGQINKPTYIVHIEDGNNFKLIRVTDDAMDVYQEYKK